MEALLSRFLVKPLLTDLLVRAAATWAPASLSLSLSLLSCALWGLLEASEAGILRTSFVALFAFK